MMQELNKVKSFRSGAGLSQDDMAEALEISRASYQMKESGKHEFKLSEMLKFVDKINDTVNGKYTIADIFM